MSPLRRSDVLVLLGYCALLFGFALVAERSLNIHETVHCQNVREMIRNGDWTFATYGGRPWLERPPLPFWLTAPFVLAFGDHVPAYRAPVALMGVVGVLLTAWMASVWFGRGVGLLSGLVLATTREFTRYAAAPECDMFLATTVTAAVAVFVRLEWLTPRDDAKERGFLGPRPLAVVGLFILLGLTNLAKGVLFGTVLALVPISLYLLVGPSPWSLIRRYVWLPGWLLFAVIASAWVVVVSLSVPDYMELWKSDIFGRMKGYLAEPWWYYAANLPLILLPWPLAALVGFFATRSRVVGNGRTPERFLWMWAVAPILLLSIPQGKHHHYLLHSLAPWAVLSALGMVRLYETLPKWALAKTPWPTVAALGVPTCVALYLAGPKLGTLAPYLPALMVAAVAVLVVLWWAVARAGLVRGCAVLFAVWLPASWGIHILNVVRDDRYAADRAFVERVRGRAKGAPVYVLNDRYPLDSSWQMFYLRDDARLVHNPTFLRAAELPDELYLVARRENGQRLAPFGTLAVLDESTRTRDELVPGDRLALFRFSRPADTRRVSAKGVRITAMQATGRDVGPDLE